MARPTGFEPATCSFGGCHSIHLSYGRTPLILQEYPHDGVIVWMLRWGEERGRSEIAGLEWRQVNLETRTVGLWRSKVQNESVLYMTDRAFQVLHRRSLERGTSPHV